MAKLYGRPTALRLFKSVKANCHNDKYSVLQHFKITNKNIVTTTESE